MTVGVPTELIEAPAATVIVEISLVDGFAGILTVNGVPLTIPTSLVVFQARVGALFVTSSSAAFAGSIS